MDTGSAVIYYKTIGRGRPLLLLHGGPGSTHDYFLPWVLPLARDRQLVLIDERGSGQSQRLEDHRQYNLETMAADVEAVRVALGLGQIDLLGHSFGGILAQEVAIRYPASIRRLILASTGSSAARVNEDFRTIKARSTRNCVHASRRWRRAASSARTARSCRSTGNWRTRRRRPTATSCGRRPGANRAIRWVGTC